MSGPRNWIFEYCIVLYFYFYFIFFIILKSNRVYNSKHAKYKYVLIPDIARYRWNSLKIWTSFVNVVLSKYCFNLYAYYTQSVTRIIVNLARNIIFSWTVSIRLSPLTTICPIFERKLSMSKGTCNSYWIRVRFNFNFFFFN